MMIAPSSNEFHKFFKVFSRYASFLRNGGYLDGITVIFLSVL